MEFTKELHDDQIVAIVARERLRPVSGRDGIIFPPTYAPPKDGKEESAGYVIDDIGGQLVCLVDSVGSQANRMEGVFLRPEHAHLVPRIEIQVGERRLSLLELGHRAADAAARHSDKDGFLRQAFEAIRKGDALPMAKIAPTSIVFGAWDSRGTQVKLPRLVEASIRAYDVARVSRAAQYFTSLQKEEQDALGVGKEALGEFASEEGLVDVPSGRAIGGVVVRGAIRREAVLNLTALRLVKAPSAEESARLRKYILGLCLVAFSAEAECYLRQGCLLVREADSPAEAMLVSRDGTSRPVELDRAAVLEFATAAAREFGVGPARELVFSAESVKAAKKKGEKKGEKKGKAE